MQWDQSESQTYLKAVSYQNTVFSSFYDYLRDERHLLLHLSRLVITPTFFTDTVLSNDKVPPSGERRVQRPERHVI